MNSEKKREINVHMNYRMIVFYFVGTISKVRITESSCVSINLILTRRKDCGQEQKKTIKDETNKDGNSREKRERERVLMQQNAP